MALSLAQHVGSLCPSRLPDVAEHGGEHANRRRIGLERFDDLANFALDLIAFDGFAVGFAGFGLAQVVGIGSAVTLRKGRAQRHLTAGADSDAAQGECIADILALRSLGLARATLLYLVEGLQRDQRFVLRLEPVNPVTFGTNMPGVNRLGQDIRHPLLGKLAVLEMRKVGKGFEIAFHFGLAAKTPVGIAFECFADDARQRLVRHEDLAAPLLGFVLQANGRAVDKVTRLHTRFHLLCDLPTILLAL
ncbi:MAG: hypothetical protein BM562_16625 [Alphaproteobacteria bacterium MedPE-SWcel]|nr:MAG: hypothetical protein BM562_16625 [Alphaproteobacteria bacterium MedPE-SWcel]